MTEEKRQYLRLPAENRVFIELVAPAAGSGDAADIVVCKSINLSRGGLRVSLDRELVVGAILQIGVELPAKGETFYLAGEVRWCLPDREDANTWSAGFELLKAAGSDFEQWEATLRSLNS